VLRAEDLGFREIEQLARWLRLLIKPTALFACNDVRALQVLQACQFARLPVPDQVAVLGVDNDEIITQISHPKLSSIQPDTILTGYKACVCLDGLMRDRRKRPQIDYTPPLGVIERESTNIIATTDKLVEQALRSVRQEACRGLTVKDLLDQLKICRTNLEVRFKRVLGRTVHDEITRVRLKRVCQFLHMGDLTLQAIARQTGYLDVSHMSRLFKKHFGLWPGQYRRQLNS
jgi:LacI family transcriptional regulator